MKGIRHPVRDREHLDIREAVELYLHHLEFAAADDRHGHLPLRLCLDLRLFDILDIHDLLRRRYIPEGESPARPDNEKWFFLKTSG